MKPISRKATPPSAASVAKHLLAVRDASESFGGFVKLMQPDWRSPPFQQEFIEILDALERREYDTNRVLINMPPRHAKSALATVLFPAYFMARDPRRYLMSGSYNAQLASDFGRQVRHTITDPRIMQAFPDIGLSKDSSAADVWRTDAGGAYFAVGIGGTTSGRPANALIIDDPIKSREEAESPTNRRKVWDYYTAALSTRLQPEIDGQDPIQIVVLTRWHPDDLGGRLMELEDWDEGLWTHVRFQAINQHQVKLPAAEIPATLAKYANAPDNPFAKALSRRRTPSGDPLLPTLSEEKRIKALTPHIQIADEENTDGTKTLTIERALWPERFSLEALHRQRRLNPRDFAALYQQEPYIEGGNLIKQSWWQEYEGTPETQAFQSIVIAADTAFKANEQADYSVAVTAGLDAAGDIYILDIMRRKLAFPDLKQALIHLNNRWRGKGLRGLYIEDKASGQSLIQELRRQSGIAVIAHKVVHDKVARLNAVLPLIEGGRVFLPKSAPWLDDFLKEAISFPSGPHDDQIDALVIALDALSRTHISPDQWLTDLDPDQSLNNPNVTKSLGKSLSKMAFGNNRWKGWGL